MGSIDPNQLSRWFTAYGPVLVLYARQWLGGSLAEDVVQDVFVRLMAQRVAPTNVTGWLFRSVRNAALSELRSGRRRQRREQRAAAKRQGWFEDHADEPVSAAEAEAALVALTDEQREVVVLRIWGELRFQEIAAIVDQPVSTLFSRYKAGLAVVRRKLELSCKTKTD